MNTMKLEEIPVLGPLLVLLRAQEFILTLIALVIGYVIQMNPALEEVRSPMTAIATVLFGLLISGQLAGRLQGQTAGAVWKAIFTPFTLLLRSRKFWVGVAALIADIAVALVPELEPLRVELIATITAIAMSLIATIAWEDTSRKDVTPPDTQAASAAGQPPAYGEVVFAPGSLNMEELVNKIEEHIRQRGHVITPAPKA